MHVNQIVVHTDVLSVLENHASTWSKMARIVGLMMLFVKNLRTKKKQRKISNIDYHNHDYHNHDSGVKNVISETGSAEIFQIRIQVVKIDGRKRQ